jgi:hypothetical protein
VLTACGCCCCCWRRVAASKRDVSLYLPLIIPAGFGFIGSFGGITRFKVKPSLSSDVISECHLL